MSLLQVPEVESQHLYESLKGNEVQITMKSEGIVFLK